MTRVVFFSESLPPSSDPIAQFSFDFIRSLSVQDYDVKLLTTFEAREHLPADLGSIEILQPLQKWNWLELPKVAQLLFQIRPDVVHVMQPYRESLRGLTNIFTMLPGVLPLLGNPILVTSLFDCRDEYFKQIRILLESSDAITVSRQPQRQAIERFFSNKTKKPLIQVLPISGTNPIGDSSDSEDNESMLEKNILDFFSQHKKVILLPGVLDSHRHLDELFTIFHLLMSADPDVAVVALGDWGNISKIRRQKLVSYFSATHTRARFYLTGPVNPRIEQICFNQAYLSFLAALPNESFELTRLLRLALSVESAMVINAEQAFFDPLPWEDEETVLLTSSSPISWGAKLARGIEDELLVQKIKMSSKLTGLHSILDQPTNIASRLYTDTIARRHL